MASDNKSNYQPDDSGNLSQANFDNFDSENESYNESMDGRIVSDKNRSFSQSDEKTTKR